MVFHTGINEKKGIIVMKFVQDMTAGSPSKLLVSFSLPILALVKLNRNDLLKFRNFGKKSLTELDELLTSLNLKFGMDVSIYKLDKD